MSESGSSVTQTVIGDRNIFAGTGDIYITQQPVPLPPEEVKTREQLRILLNKVHTFWIKGVLEESVHAAALIDLGKKIEAEAVDHPWEMVLALPGQANQTLPANTRIVDVFEQSSRTLLILGEPGSGKTTTLLELARDLIVRAESDDDFTQPIPVVLNLSTWADKQQPLEDWNVAELSSKYQIPKRIGRPWLENHRLLPLLDGLDEVKPESRNACVKAINTFGEKVGLTGLAICSRLQEYTDLPVRLKLNGAISLQPLTQDQVDGYLSRGGTKLAGLRTVLRIDKDLQSLAKTPLMLSIMSLAYQDVSEDMLAELSSGSLEEHRKHLFNTYIERMFDRKGKGLLSYARERTKAWLIWIAQKMHQNSLTIFLIERMQPSWLEQRWLYRILVGLGAGMVFGLFWIIVSLLEDKLMLFFSSRAGLVAGQGPRSVIFWGMYFGFVAVSFVGLVTLVVVGLFAGLGDIKPAERITWSWEKIRDKWKMILVLGLVWFIVFLLTDELLVGLGLGLVVVPPAVYFLGMIRGRIESTSQPNQGIWLSARNALFIWLVSALVLALVFVVLLFLVLGLTVWLVAGLVYGLRLVVFVGGIVGMVVGGKPFIQHFVLRFILWRKGLLPWRLARFLDFAAELIFLRKVGGGYTFIHRYMLEHFAELES